MENEKIIFPKNIFVLGLTFNSFIYCFFENFHDMYTYDKMLWFSIIVSLFYTE